MKGTSATQKCKKCKSILREGTELVGKDASGNDLYHRFGYCDKCKSKIDLDLTSNTTYDNVNEKKEPNLMFLDAICILSLVFCVFSKFIGLSLLGFAITLFWLILYYAIKGTFEKKKYKTDNIKKTLITISVFFLVEFGIVILF